MNTFSEFASRSSYFRASTKRGRASVRVRLLVPLLLGFAFVPLRAEEAAGTYRDASLPIEQRVQDLMRRLDVDEKVGQLNQRLYGWQCYRRNGDKLELTEILTSEVKRWRGMGTIYGLLRADPWSGVTWESGVVPEERVELLNQVQRYVMANSRWGIPALFSSEGSHGYFVLGGTVLPTAIGMGSTWNPALYQEAARAIGAEARLSGEHMVMVSCLDVARDPRWGRTEECFSEDPVLVSRMARAGTVGIQGGAGGDVNHPDRAVMILKHLAGQGASAGGHNAAAAAIGPREFREIHYPPIRAGVGAGALSVMAAYNEIDGIPSCANPELLRRILREQLGFDGAVMADGTALDNLTHQTGSAAASGVQALRAGIDISLWDDAFTTLADSVRAGRIEEGELNEAVANVLRLKFRLGLFEHPLVTESPGVLEVVQTRSKAAALQLARESLVLLRNEGGLLPFSKTLKRIAVIGPNADNVYAQNGDYTPPQREGQTTTVLRGIRELLGAQADVRYARGVTNRGQDQSGMAEAVELARTADAVVLVLGGSSNRFVGTHYAATGAALVGGSEKEMDCGEGVDLANLDLSEGQIALAKAVRATGRPLAVVLVQGRPHSIPWIADNCPAILCAWYPGQEGGRAIAEVLFGEVNPSGRLSISVPRSSAQLPVYYDAKIKGDSAYYDIPGSPQWPFGYGLSYTSFELSHLTLTTAETTAAAVNAGGTITVSVDVKNTGTRAGAETVQVYLHGIESAITRRVRELKAFEKVSLQPGETRTLTFQLGRDELGIWGPDMSFAAGPGLNEIQVQGGVGPAISARVRLK